MLLAILNAQEQKRFDYPQRLTSALRQQCFNLPPNVAKAINRLRSPTHKVGFMLQYGHFIATQRFYLAQRFHEDDVFYVASLLNVDIKEVNLSTYKKKTPNEHRKTILHLCQCYEFDNDKTTDKVNKYIKTIIAEHISLKTIFVRTLMWLHEQKIEIPSYHGLAERITDGFRQFEMKLIKKTNRSLNKSQKIALDQLLGRWSFPTIFV